MTRQEENRQLIYRLLYRSGFDVERFKEKKAEEREQKLSSPVAHLRKCLRDQLVIDKYQKIKEALKNA